MSDTQPCGHDTSYIVQADEGTAYCAMCEYEAAQERRQAAQRQLIAAEEELDAANQNEMRAGWFVCQLRHYHTRK